MKLNKIKNKLLGRDTPSSGKQTNTPIPGCFDAPTPSKDVVIMQCSDISPFKKIFRKLFSKSK